MKKYRKAFFSRVFCSLRNRIVCNFLAVTLVSIILIGIFAYTTSRELVIQREVKQNSSQLEKIQDAINDKLNEKETLAINFYINSNVQNLLSEGENDGEDKFEVMKLLFSNDQTDINECIFLSDEFGNIYTNALANMDDARTILDKAKQALQEKQLTYKWLGTEIVNDEYVLPFVRKIISVEGADQKTMGFIVINLRESVLGDEYARYLDEAESNFFILDQEGVILSSDCKEIVGQDFEKLYGIGQMQDFDGSYSKVTIEHKNYLAVRILDERNDWSYVSLIAYNNLEKGILSIGIGTIVICFIAVLLALLLSVALSEKITKPISELTEAMEEVQYGNMDVHIEVQGNDEIAELGNFFNQMVQRLQDSVEQIYKAEKAKRDAEMKALVLQINPHFLYNTLSSIIWLCQAKRTEEVIEMVSALAKLFRIGISKGSEIVTISQEFEHVASYMKIQQIRFNNKFSYSIDIDEEIADCCTIKIILQPLVENTVNHAITDLEYPGVIQLKARKKEDAILLSVTDNANGMTEEQVEQLNRHLSTPLKEQNDFGIGTKNVNERVKLLFGEAYGLSYQKKEKYITATIKIPIVEHAEELA